MKDLVTDKPLVDKKKYQWWRWRQETEYKCPYSSVAEMGMIQLQLMDGETPISFWSGPASEFDFANNSNPGFRWVILKADKAIGKITEDAKAGMVSIKLLIVDVARFGRQHDIPAFITALPKRLGKVLKIKCFIFQCKEIPSADDDGQSDCYISVWNQQGDKITTEVVDDNLNPIYYKCVDLLYEMDNFKNCPPIVLTLWDKNSVLADVYLGKTVIFL